MTSGAATFTGPLTSGTYVGGLDYLYAVSPNYGFAYDLYPNRPAVPQGPPGISGDYPWAGTLDVSLSGSYSAASSGLYVVQTGVNETVAGPVQIAVTDQNCTYNFEVTTSTQYINFVGFLSNSTITSVQYESIDDTNQQFVNISNVTYGMNETVPERSSLALAASGTIGVAIMVGLRRRRLKRRFKS